MSVLEPFGYFRSTPFGWEDCAENAEGAKPLYEISAEDALAALGWYARMEKSESRVLELERVVEVLLRDYSAVHGDGDLEMHPALNQAIAAVQKHEGGDRG